MVFEPQEGQTHSPPPGWGAGAEHGTVIFSADPVHHSVAVKDTITIAAAHQYIRKLAHFLLVFAVEVGEAAFRTVSVTQFKFNLVKPGESTWIVMSNS